MSKQITYMVAVLLVGALASCNSSKPDEGTDAKKVNGERLYTGNLKVAVDAGLENIIKQEAEVFEYLNDSVTLQISYLPEKDVFEAFIKDSADVMILAREFTRKDKNLLKQRDTVYAREQTIAYDAVAMVGNLKFDDSKLDVATLSKLLEAGNNAKTELVFESRQSSSVEQVLTLLGYSQKAAANVYALKSVDEVIEYVEKKENVIGFVPYSFLSDTDDDKVKKILKRIKILSLRVKNEKGEEQRTSANQSDIATGVYPLRRTVSAVRRYTYRDNRENLFVNFLYREKGAKIFLKAGLIPAKMPEREINVNTEGIPQGD